MQDPNCFQYESTFGKVLAVPWLQSSAIMIAIQ
jgi:hypothetical protein